MAKKFQFTLKIDDEDRSMSPENGLPFQKFGELLISLFKAIDSNTNSTCSVREIKKGSYGATFATDDEALYKNFEIVHRNIERCQINELDERQREYAVTLKKILGGRYFIQAENTKGEEIATIKDLDKQSFVDSYYTSETLYGVLSQIGSPHVDSPKKYIYIDGVDYRISVSREQDAELKQYYTSHKLRAKVRHKRSSLDGHIISAELVSFIVVGDMDILDSLKEVGYVDFDLIKDAETMDDIVNKIYGTQ